METEPLPRLSRLQDRLQDQERGLHGFRWLGRLLRLGQAKPGGDGVSESNGHANGDLETFIRGAARDAVKRVEERDPLSEENQDGETWLLLGAQGSYDPTFWSLDPRGRFPIGSPERKAYEADPNKVTHLSGKAQELYRFLDKLDGPSGFNKPED